LVRRWRTLIKENSALTLDDCLTAATALNDGQLRQADNLLPSLSIRPTFLRLFDARQALRVYAALAPGQQKALWLGQSVALAQMTPPPRAQFLAAFQDREQARVRNAPVTARAVVLSPEARFSLTSEPWARVVEQ